MDDRAVNTSRLIFSQAAKDPDIGNWYYTEGAELSYLCFAKVLENKLPLSLEELKPLAQHYIEMLKADLYMKRLCGVSVSLNDQIISICFVPISEYSACSILDFRTNIRLNVITDVVCIYEKRQMV